MKVYHNADFHSSSIECINSQPYQHADSKGTYFKLK